MITLSRTELQRLINLIVSAKAEAQALVDDPDCDNTVGALASLYVENMLALECKLINARDSDSKRIAIV